MTVTESKTSVTMTVYVSLTYEIIRSRRGWQNYSTISTTLTMKQLPPITTKQQEILTLLYTYRFLNRQQIQSLLRHKDKRRVISWLKDLREKQYVDWQYDATDFIAKSQPAIYYLVLNGIRHLRTTNLYPTTELRLRYKDSNRTPLYINRCIFIANCVISLFAKSDHTTTYECVLHTGFGAIAQDIRELAPHLIVYKRTKDETYTYYLEYFEHVIPRYQLRKRLKDYVLMLAGQDDTPIVLLVCDTTADLLYIRRRLRYIANEEIDAGDVTIRIALRDQIDTHGVGSKIWEDVL